MVGGGKDTWRWKTRLSFDRETGRAGNEGTEIGHDCVVRLMCYFSFAQDSHAIGEVWFGAKILTFDFL